MTQLRKGWIWLSDEEAEKFDTESVVAVATPIPKLLTKVFLFKHKPTDVQYSKETTKAIKKTLKKELK